MDSGTRNEGISLLRRGQKGLMAVVFSRMGIVLLLFVLQILVIFAAFRWFAGFLPHLFTLAVLADAVMVPVLLCSRLDPTAKITWLIVVMLLNALLFPQIQRYSVKEVAYSEFLTMLEE